MLHIILIILLIIVAVCTIAIVIELKKMNIAAKENHATLKELNANIKYLKRKYNESIDVNDGA